ncbi:protein export cytoplasm protein SecA ATPase RNA helicase [Vibrio ponticus]|uniref:SEC-C metal-binding domain-containing protein n=1 Tax=Vibrio rhodolitus TaxID=2231649 RepID=UPI00050850CE|nr:YecA family protein [Vibrio rhodolitus]GAK87675.1 protein export cytoplasm protein SecA ATPase RNA helicase [Vibrio ponticus]
MNYQLISLAELQCQESQMFIEGVTLAANLATKPLQPEAWLEQVFADSAEQLNKPVVGQINHQYSFLKRNEYSLLALVSGEQQAEKLADFAEGFMTLWPTIEPQWLETETNDGTLRMLQAMLTTFMLAIDEEQTQAQMQQAGIETPPALADLIEQIDLMINEVAQAADAALVGNKGQSVNPYKEVGRNDPCTCGSGKKFKQCCGK